MNNIHDCQINSRAIGRPMLVRVITPPGYDARESANFPVLYFLHPWGLSPDYITGKLNIHQHLRRGVTTGTLPPFVIVLPDGERSFFINAADPSDQDWTPVLESNDRFFENALDQYGAYGDYIKSEVIPFVETSFRVRTDRAGRAIGGISMGGAAAAIHAFRDPTQFCAVGIHSPAIFDGPPNNGGPPWIFGLTRSEFARRNPADLARQLKPITAPRIYLDTGHTDAMVEQVKTLHAALESHAIPHHYHIRPGGHDKTYWEPHMTEYLGFYAQEWFKQNESDR